MQDIALFLDEEKKAFAAYAQSDLFDEAGKLCLIIDDVTAEGFDGEKIAAAYLLVNALLMGRHKRPMVKLICFNPKNGSDMASVINVLRAHFHSQFSSLGQIDLWKRVLGLPQDFTTSALVEMENTTNFFTGTHIGQHATSFNRADVFLGFIDKDVEAKDGGQFSLNVDDSFELHLSAFGGVKQRISAGEMFTAKRNSYMRGRQGLNNVIRLSQKTMEGSVKELMDELDALLDGTFYETRAAS